MALKNYQYEAIMRDYDQRRSTNAHIQNRHIEEVYKSVPEIRALDREVSSISMKKARQLLEGKTSSLDDLKNELSQLTQKRRELLIAHGFPEDYMDPVYTCPDCKDTGYINNEKCHCFMQASIDLLYSQSHLQSALEDENFNTFRLDYYSDTTTDPVTGQTPFQAVTRAVEESKNFIRKFSIEYQNLLFYGTTGVGKTFLTHCIAKELLDTSHSVLYFNTIQLFDAFMKIISDRRDNKEDPFHEEIYNCDLLIIDDLGTESESDFFISQLFHCLDTRDSLKKATIISTNLSLQKIRDKYSERIFSRISSRFKIIKLCGDDIRMLKKLHNY